MKSPHSALLFRDVALWAGNGVGGPGILFPLRGYPDLRTLAGSPARLTGQTALHLGLKGLTLTSGSPGFSSLPHSSAGRDRASDCISRSLSFLISIRGEQTVQQPRGQRALPPPLSGTLGSRASRRVSKELQGQSARPRPGGQ